MSLGAKDYIYIAALGFLGLLGALLASVQELSLLLFPQIAILSYLVAYRQSFNYFLAIFFMLLLDGFTNWANMLGISLLLFSLTGVIISLIAQFFPLFTQKPYMLGRSLWLVTMQVAVVIYLIVIGSSPAAANVIISLIVNLAVQSVLLTLEAGSITNNNRDINL